jgi:hypothetical protein
MGALDHDGAPATSALPPVPTMVAPGDPASPSCDHEVSPAAVYDAVHPSGPSPAAFAPSNEPF